MFIVQMRREREKMLDLYTLETMLRESDLAIYGKLPSINAIICSMNAKAYSSRFEVKLTHDLTKKGSKGYTIDGYKEEGEAKIPEDWKALVGKIHLLYLKT